MLDDVDRHITHQWFQWTPKDLPLARVDDLTSRTTSLSWDYYSINMLYIGPFHSDYRVQLSNLGHKVEIICSERRVPAYHGLQCQQRCVTATCVFRLCTDRLFHSFIHSFIHTYSKWTTRILLQIITQYEEIVQNAKTRLVTWKNYL